MSDLTAAAERILAAQVPPLTNPTYYLYPLTLGQRGPDTPVTAADLLAVDAWGRPSGWLYAMMRRHHAEWWGPCRRCEAAGHGLCNSGCERCRRATTTVPTRDDCIRALDPGEGA